MNRCWWARPKLRTRVIRPRFNPRLRRSTIWCAPSLHLFPQVKLSAGDIRYTFAGVRPLPFAPKENASAVTRKHYLHDHAQDGAEHMISVIGGKLTTAAELARQCAAKIGVSPKSSRTIAIASAEGAALLLDQWVIEIGGTAELAKTRPAASSNGTASAPWISRAWRNAAPDLRAPLCSHSEHIVAEAVDAFAGECAATLGDVLLRRVPVALGACWSPACSREAAARIGAVMGWNETQIRGPTGGIRNRAFRIFAQARRRQS